LDFFCDKTPQKQMMMATSFVNLKDAQRRISRQKVLEVINHNKEGTWKCVFFMATKPNGQAIVMAFDKSV
jgi:hypothetical protein